MVVFLPQHVRKAGEANDLGAEAEVVWGQVRCGPRLFFDVRVLLLSKQWAWLGASACGQMRSYYISP